MCLNFIAARYVLGSQIYPLMAVKLGWDTDKEVQSHVSILAGCAILGAATGAGVGSKMMAKGRRRAILFMAFTFLIGSALLQVLNFWPILIGSVI